MEWRSEEKEKPAQIKVNHKHRCWQHSQVQISDNKYLWAGQTDSVPYIYKKYT